MSFAARGRGFEQDPKSSIQSATFTRKVDLVTPKKKPVSIRGDSRDYSAEKQGTKETTKYTLNSPLTLESTTRELYLKKIDENIRITRPDAPSRISELRPNS